MAKASRTGLKARSAKASPGGLSEADKKRRLDAAMKDPLFARGMGIRRAVWGKATDDLVNSATDFNWPLTEYVTRSCFGDVWNRKGLSRRDRSLITVAALVAMSRPNEIKVHVKGAIANGVTKEELSELILHIAVYSGVPRGVEGFRSAAEALREIGLE